MIKLRMTALFALLFLVTGGVFAQGAGSEWERLHRKAMKLSHEGNYDRAVLVAKQALEMAEKNVGSDHSDVVASLNNLAALYYTQAKYPPYGYGEGHYAHKYKEAGPLYERALAINEKALGPDHPDVAKSLFNLAALYQTRPYEKKHAQVNPFFKRALAIQEKAFGPDHPDVAKSLCNLADLYQRQGGLVHVQEQAMINGFMQADAMHERALAIREKALGPDAPDVVQSLHNLAWYYYAQGKYTQAEPLYERALAISEKVLGPDHPSVALRLENLIVLYRATDQEEEAEKLEQRAARIRATK